MPRFFIPITKTTGEVFLDADQTHHAVSVFRLKKGDKLELFDGIGHRFFGVAGNVLDGRLSVRVTEKSSSEPLSLIEVSLAVAVFRPERMEILIQKACELDARAIIPLLTERCIVKLSQERWQSKIKRWQKIIQESCKQCGQSRLPDIAEPLRFENFISEIKNYDLALIPTLESATVGLAETLGSKFPKRILVLIGPEGDFSPQEVTMALEAGARPVSLGPLVLRSETAGMYALSAIHFFYREVKNVKK